MAPIGPDGSVGSCPPSWRAFFDEFQIWQIQKMTSLRMIAAARLVRLGLFVLVGLLLGGRTPAAAQQFAADPVRQQGSAAAVSAGRLFVVGDKVRIETPELADGFFLIDGAIPSAHFVRPATRVYMDARESSPLTRWLVPVDPDNPCRQWQAMTRLAGAADQGDWHCERIGQDQIGGRDVIAYRAFSGEHEQFRGWVDPLYKFPLRIKTEDGAVITVENIQDMRQPMHPMQIPEDFRKFDPEVLIRQVKQSDVWVTTP
jgi:hypothetical protein